MRRLLIAGMAAVCLAGVSACSDEAEEPNSEASAEPSNETLASSLNDAPGLTTVASGLGDSGLAKVFDGTASYTLLAPTDDAFGKLGDKMNTLKGPENRAAMAAILRDHILPGHLTPTDIDAANGAAIPIDALLKNVPAAVAN